MVDAPKKQLTHQEYLIALALYTMAAQQQRLSDQSAIALAQHLGREGLNDIGHISDELYSPANRTFTKLLELEGFSIAPEKVSP